jgi:hypothetical protein
VAGAVGFGELTDVAPVAVTAVVARVFMHGSSGIPGLQSQTVDVADAGLLPPDEGTVEDAGEVAADEHAAARREAASSPAATAAIRENWCFAPDLDGQVTCISLIRCNVRVDGRERNPALPLR